MEDYLIDWKTRLACELGTRLGSTTREDEVWAKTTATLAEFSRGGTVFRLFWSKGSDDGAPPALPSGRIAAAITAPGETCDDGVLTADGTMTGREQAETATLLAHLAEMVGSSVARTRERERERRRIEAELTTSQAQLRTLATNAPVAIFIKDLEGRYLLANPLACVALGVPGGVEGKVDTDLVPADLAARFRKNDLAVMRSGKTELFEETVGVENGEAREFLSAKFPLPGPNGEAAGVCGVALDITERKASEEALQEADRRKDEFLAVLAHELRNPLAPLRSALAILAHRGDDPQTRAELLHTMNRQVAQMVRLIDDLLDLSRISRGKLRIAKERVALEDVVSAAAEAAAPHLEERAQRLIIEQSPESIALEADACRLAQVISNLLNNASTYSPAGSEIRLGASVGDGSVRLVVTDEGKGIEEGMAERIFEMFTQADDAPAGEGNGLGIGLTLVRSLVSLHGGTVTAAGNGSAPGSTFTVTLPHSDAPPAAVDPTGDTPESARRPTARRILVADDNRDAARGLTMLLEIHGHEVVTAYGGEEAWARIESHAPEVVVLDLGMPGMSGYEVAARLWESPIDPRPLLVALTGWAQEKDRQKTREAGFDHHLVKPLDVEELLALIVDG